MEDYKEKALQYITLASEFLKCYIQHGCEQYIYVSGINPTATIAISCIWGDGAETKSQPICLSDARFGYLFIHQVNHLFEDFSKQVHTAGHGADMEFSFETTNEKYPAYQFVCRSGSFKK